MLIKPGAPKTEPLDFSKVAASGDLLRVSELSQSFGELEVLRGLELKLAPEEVIGLVGPSGCGKSTLLEVIAGLREPSAGTVEIAGSRDPARRLAGCAYMPQRDLLLPWLSAIDNAALALRVKGYSRERARVAARPLFKRFGLDGFEAARPAELSGGMRQRVAFLRTLIGGKPLLLLDEPFASLDAITRAEMQQWLAEALRADRRSVLLVTHDVEEALYVCDRVIVLSARPGRVVETIEVPEPRATDRDRAVTAPEFAAMRERALLALHGEPR